MSMTLPMPFGADVAAGGIPQGQLGEVIKSMIDGGALPNSRLNRQQADRFIDLVVQEARLLSYVRKVRKDHPKGETNKLNITQIVSEGARATSRLVPSGIEESVVSFDMEKYRSGIDIASEFEEDNIEKGGIRDTIMRMFTKAIANDQESAMISGDQSLTVGDGQSKENNLYGVNDGFHKILLDNVPNIQVIDCEGAAPSKALYHHMARLIPTRFRSVKDQYKFFVPCFAFDDWTYDWTARNTVGGDSALSTGRAAGPMGIDLLEIPKFPTDLVYGASDQFDDGSFIWLGPPSQMVHFMQRDITIEWERRPRLDKWEATIHWRADWEIDDPDMFVIAVNVGSTLGAAAYAP